MLTSFAFSFANFFQPGVFWPELADYKPMQVIAREPGVYWAAVL